MDNRKYQYFIAIAEQGSFSKAARVLYVSQPYLSRLVSDLEKELDVKLFRREKNLLSLTQAGEYYLNYCRSMVLMHDNMKSELIGFSEHTKGRIRIGMSTSNGSYILPPALKEFKNECPNVFVSIDDEDDQALLKKTLDGSLDMSFFCLTDYPDELDTALIRTEPILLVLPPGHPMGRPEAKGNYLNPPCIGKEDLLMLRFDPFISIYKTKGMALHTGQIFRACGFKPVTAYEFHNVETALQMTKQGHGYTFTPQLIAKSVEFQDPPYYYFVSLDSQSILQRSHVAAFRKGRKLNRAENTLITCIRKYT